MKISKETILKSIENLNLLQEGESLNIEYKVRDLNWKLSNGSLITEIFVSSFLNAILINVEDTVDSNIQVVTKKMSINDFENQLEQGEVFKDAADPKYSGIPNICFSLTKPEDKRELVFSKQRLARGFDDSETWSLRDTIAAFIIPRLELYEEFANDILIREPELINGIQDFLNMLKLISRNEGACFFNDEEQKQVERGLNAFPEVFLSLWW